MAVTATTWAAANAAAAVLVQSHGWNMARDGMRAELSRGADVYSLGLDGTVMLFGRLVDSGQQDYRGDVVIGAIDMDADAQSNAAAVSSLVSAA